MDKLDLKGPLEKFNPRSLYGESPNEVWIDIPFGVQGELLEKIVEVQKEASEKYGLSSSEENLKEEREALENRLGDTPIMYTFYIDSFDGDKFNPHKDWTVKIEIQGFAGFKINEANRKILESLGVDEMVEKEEWSKIYDQVLDSWRSAGY